jgi:hypothetical protein
MSRVIDGYSASSALFHTCSIQASFFFMGIVLLFIKEIQEIQGGQEAPHNGGAISPKDA